MADPTLPVAEAPGTVAAQVNKGQQFTSFDVNAFEVPHQREEVWRFTPFRRLRGLLGAASPALWDEAARILYGD